jgi:cyclophilin family peptidyl-prolyl cis-trans isomerase/HEAT repeat protein
MRHARLVLASWVVLLLGAGSASAGISNDILKDILIHEQSRSSDDGVLAKYTQDKKPEVRARAYRALGRLQDPALLSVLARGLEDKEESVRLEAAFDVGQLFDAVAESTVTTALDRESSPAVKARLVEALGKCGTSNAAVARLAGLLQGTDVALAREAGLALGVMASRSVPILPAAAALRDALSNPDPDVRWHAAFAVQRGKVRDAVTGLRRSLKQKDTLTLLYSARAAGAVKNQDLAEFLIPLLSHPDWRVRVETLRALGSINYAYYTSQASLLLEDPNPHVVLTAIETMGKMSSGGGLGRVEDLEHSSDWRIRAAVVRAEIEGMGDGAVTQAKDAIKDTDWRIRAAVAEGLGKLGSEEALLLMDTMAKDESPQVAAAVVTGLVSCQQKYAVEMIRGYLDSGDPAVLGAAAHGAGQRHDYAAIPKLLTAYDKLQSPVDTEVMVEIVNALGSILTAKPADDPVGTLSPEDSTRAVALLESARHQSDATLAKAAAGALTQITGTTVSPATELKHEVPKEFDLDLALKLAEGKKKPVARLITSRGTITVRLLGEEAPGTVANFVALARRGYYNGLSFHRVVADFVIQGGDPRGDGWGGPGYVIRCEYNPIRYKEGMVGMALSGKDTGGSQFFITHSPQPHLNGKYTIFGEVQAGMDVVNQIQMGDLIQEVRVEGL